MIPIIKISFHVNICKNKERVETLHLLFPHYFSFPNFCEIRHDLLLRWEIEERLRRKTRRLPNGQISRLRRVSRLWVVYMIPVCQNGMKGIKN
jgi:hypothetical protein